MISSFYFVSFCLKGVTWRDIKLLSKDLEDILLPLCPEPWTELLTPGAVRTKHQSPVERRTVSGGGGSHSRAGGLGRRAQGRALLRCNAFSLTCDYFEVFGTLCLQVTLQAVFVAFQFAFLVVICLGKKHRETVARQLPRKPRDTQLANHKARGLCDPFFPLLQHFAII